MHAALQRGYPPHAALLSAARIGRPALAPPDQDADNIDDILRNLWPTSSPVESGYVRAVALDIPRSRTPASSLSSGTRTPPEPEPYALAAAPVVAPVAARPPARSISASIQIGDPEWRVDSPQSLRASPEPAAKQALAPRQPSPASRAKPVAAQCAPLGLGHAGRALAPQLRRATLGLLRSGNAARVLTPEERVARLHTVSGLAARAVARRCLSGQIARPDADAMLRQAAAGPPLKKKPTFADVARGSQD
ncbi:hypothetical protein IWW54_004726 [Coemansia sp. RSA 2705]|nr:hypothetical protein IWW54_004726 [Coemansia sp. RSA 2705]